jgi:hypothetical protein
MSKAYEVYTIIEKKISNATMEMLQVPDKYCWAYIIKNKKSAKASLYGMIVLQGIAVLGIEYGLGLLANNPDMVYAGLYTHLGLDAVMVTLAPSWGRFKDGKIAD